jgi:LysM repeat protein
MPGGWQALYAANKRAVGPQPNLIRSGTVLQVAAERSYTVAPGDTLASIAAALRTHGGWQALYAANKRVIGQDPDIIRPGTTLTLPSQQAASHPALPPARVQHQAQSTTPATPEATAQRAPVRHDNTTAGGIMPGWLKLILLLAGLLTLTSFVIEPVAVLARRRRQATQAAQAAARAAQAEAPPKGASPGHAAPPDDRPPPAKSRIIQADHDRLIVTYSAHDDTVYLLTPPGEDPWSVLRASRIVVPEHTFVELADHLGVPSVWPYE